MIHRIWCVIKKSLQYRRGFAPIFTVFHDTFDIMKNDVRKTEDIIANDNARNRGESYSPVSNVHLLSKVSNAVTSLPVSLIPVYSTNNRLLHLPSAVTAERMYTPGGAFNLS